MEPEPKRFTVRWRDGSYRVSDPTLPDEVHAYHADDPAIVQALAVRKACHEAGLLDEHGNLIKPRWITHEDGRILFRPTDDDDYVDVGDTLFIGRLRNVTFSTRSAAERAAGEAGNGGNDGQ